MISKKKSSKKKASKKTSSKKPSSKKKASKKPSSKKKASKKPSSKKTKRPKTPNAKKGGGSVKAQEGDDFDNWISGEVQKPEESLPQEVLLLQKEVSRCRGTIKKLRATETIIQKAIIDLVPRPQKVQRIKPPPVDKRGTPEEIAVLHVSDTQLGKITQTYNIETCRDRLHLLFLKTLAVVKSRRKSAPVRHLRIYLGGDMVEGEDIFPTQPHLIAPGGVFEQAVKVGPLIFATLIANFLEHFDTVKVCTVPGNHGRNSHRAHPKTNWDDVLYMATKYRMEDNEGNLDPRLTFDVSPCFYYVDRIFSWGNLIVHGHQIKGGFAGFPFYGAAKKAWGWIDSIEEEWDNLYFGHFHTYTSGTLNHRYFLCNGTTESDNDYARQELAASGYPVQRLGFYTAKHGRIADYPIYLSSRDSQLARRKV